jgi:hypothetical protein
MEFILNLAWALSAVTIACLGLRYAPHSGSDRRTHLVALAVLVLVLFPVISVTDDLRAMQNPAEADSCLRRNQISGIAHSVFSTVAALPLPAFAGISLGFLRLAAPSSLLAPMVDHSALASIQNRPPPAL